MLAFADVVHLLAPEFARRGAGGLPGAHVLLRGLDGSFLRHVGILVDERNPRMCNERAHAWGECSLSGSPTAGEERRGRQYRRQEQSAAPSPSAAPEPVPGLGAAPIADHLVFAMLRCRGTRVVGENP